MAQMQRHRVVIFLWIGNIGMIYIFVQTFAILRRRSHGKCMAWWSRGTAKLASP